MPKYNVSMHENIKHNTSIIGRFELDIYINKRKVITKRSLSVDLSVMCVVFVY